MAVDEIAERLYGLPLGEFIKARNDAAAELRKPGAKEDAEEAQARRRLAETEKEVERAEREVAAAEKAPAKKR